MGKDLTTEWLKNRRQGWRDHHAALDEDKAIRQVAYDKHVQAREAEYSDWHADEAHRVAIRDMFPSGLDMAKEGRTRASEDRQLQMEDRERGLLEHNQDRGLALEDRDRAMSEQGEDRDVGQADHDEDRQVAREDRAIATGAYREQVLDEASHPKRLQKPKKADKGMAWTHEVRDPHGEWSPTSLGNWMRAIPADWERQQRASGIWGGHTYEEHSDAVARLDHDGQQRYVQATIAGMSPGDALAHAKGTPRA
jgi:hypothetical protein